MSTVVLIRPGSTDFDEQNRIQGTLDLPLNRRGQEQVEHLVDELQNVPIEVIYAAPGEPALSTAEAIGGALEIPVKVTEGFRNLDQGLWQGLQVDELRRKFPKVFKQWHESPECICPPEGEKVAQAVERVRKALQKPLKKKKFLAIVASEPLATLIYYVITGCKPEAPQSMYGGRQHDLIEYLKLDGTMAYRPGGNGTATNGITKNGAGSDGTTQSRNVSEETASSQPMATVVAVREPPRGDHES